MARSMPEAIVKKSLDIAADICVYTNRNVTIESLSHESARALLGCTVAVMALAAPADAKSPPRYGALVYSDLFFDPPSDDMGGTRITLLRFGYGDKIVYETTEGARDLAGLCRRREGGYKNRRAELRGEDQRGDADVPGHVRRPQAGPARSAAGSQPLRLRRIVDLGQPVPKCKF